MKCIAISTKLCLLSLLSIAMLAFGGGESQADESWKTYSVSNVDADRVRDLAETLLGGDNQHRIAVESRSNRLVVQGDAEVHRLIQQVISEVDRPEQQNLRMKTPQQNAVPRSYVVPQEQLAQLLGQVRKQFVAPGIRVAADQRTSRLIVVAPPDVQQRIARQLQGVTSPEPQVTVQRSVSFVNQPVRRHIALRKVAPNDLQEMLLSRWQKRARPSHSTDQGTVLIVPGVKDDEVQVRLDTVTRSVDLVGTPASIEAWVKVISVFDQDRDLTNATSTEVAVPQAPRETVRQVVNALSNGLGTNEAMQLLRMGRASGRATTGTFGAFLQSGQEADEAEGEQDSAVLNGGNLDLSGGMIGPVQIEFLDGLDGVIIKGKKSDVDRVMKIIEEIERLSTETEPEVNVLTLEHVDSAAMGELVNELYEQVLSTRQGPVSITPLVKPNALLLIGRPENVRVVTDLIKQLDQPVPADSQFQVIRLKYMSALDAETTISDFYEERGGLGARARVVSDYRSNAVVVQAGPRDLEEIQRLIERMDTPDSAAVNELRIFPLKNALAEELAVVLEEAFRIDDESLQGGGLGGGGGGLGGGGGQTGRLVRPRSTILTLSQLDAKGKRLLKSGVLADARVSADNRANALVVTAPNESMELIAELIDRLDAIPGAEAEIKVFTIINGEAVSLAEMLQELFGEQDVQEGPAVTTAGTGDDSTLVPLRFTVDERTNSVIASGSVSDLEVVEAILLRLDSSDSTDRQNTVYRLRSASAPLVAAAINDFLTNQREIQDIAPETLSAFERVEREVVVVAEEVSNTLIISATPRYFDEIMRLIKELDERPPMVMIQVLIAEVRLSDAEEFGVEFGLQDSLLFDRGVLSDIVTPGFAFNNAPLGNSSAAGSLATSGNVGSQGISSFGLGRNNPTLGYGGLVLSASSDSVSVLIRALEQSNRINVLSRPQIMTLDNQEGFVQVGQQVPQITTTSQTQGTIVNSVSLYDTGIVLQVTPRISPDGLVVMAINATKAEVGPVEEGIPISINDNGDVIRSPIFNTTRAQTVVSSRSGQTVVLSGLITTEYQTTHRGIPWLSSLPHVGKFFGFDQVAEQRQELLIIMTPYIVRGDDDLEWIKAVETERMHWCLSDVIAVHGDLNVAPTTSPDAPTTQTIFPDKTPRGELIPVPADESIYPSGPDSIELPPLSGPRNEAGPIQAPVPSVLKTTHEQANGREFVPLLPSADMPSRAIQWQTLEEPSKTRTFAVQHTGTWTESGGKPGREPAGKGDAKPGLPAWRSAAREQYERAKR